MEAKVTPRAGSPDRTTLLLFGGVVLCGGLNALAVRETVMELAPLWGAAMRFLAAGAIFAVLTVLRGGRLPRGRSLSGAMLYGAVGFAGAFGLIYPALREVPAGSASVVVALSPLLTYGLAIGQRQEQFQPRSLVGALIAIAGIVIVFADQLGAAVPLGGLVLVLIGTVGLAESGIIVKAIPKADPFGTNAVAMLTAGVLLLAASLALGERQAIPTLPATWLAVGYIVIFGSVVMFTLYVAGLGRWTASGMSYSTLLLPFVSVTAATLLTNERFSVWEAVGGIVMLVGVYLGAFRVARPNRSTATSMPECLPVADCTEAGTAAGTVPAPNRA